MGRSRLVPAATMALGCVVLSSHEVVASDWKIDAGVSGKETYTDNVTLSSANRQSDFITEVRPYITASKKGARLEANVVYSMQNLFYADQGSRNRTNHQLAGRAKAELFEDEIFVDATASISQQITSLLGATGETSNVTGNFSDVYSWSVSPYWQHRFGPTMNLLARYSHSEMSSGATGLANSGTDTVTANLSSGTAFKDIFWRLDFRDQKTNYSGRPDVGFMSYSGTLGYVLSPKLRVSGTMGYDKHEFLYVGSTPPQGTFWNANVSWTPSNRTSLSATTGERYTGKTYALKFDHKTRKTTWSAGYSQDVTTTSSQFSSGETYNTFETLYDSQYFISRYPDPLTRYIQVLQAMILNNLPLEYSTSFLSNQVFEQKRFDAAVSYKTAKTITTLSVSDTVRENLESSTLSTFLVDTLSASRIVKQRNATISWLWNMNQRLNATASLGISRNTFPDLGRADNLTTLNVGLNRTINDHLRGSVNYRHQQRNSNASNSDFQENAIFGAIDYKF